MKRRIYASLCLAALSVLLICTGASLFFYYHTLETQTKMNIKNECELLAAGLEYAADNEQYLEALQLGWKDSRVTLVQEDGSVSYDSDADISTLPNHGDRPEIQAAFDSPAGRGESVRYSSTLSQDTYYYAIRLSGGDQVIRLSYSTSSITSLFLRILPAVLLLAAAIFILCLLAAGGLTKRIIRPLTSIGDDLEHVDQVDCYDELSPFLRKISHQNSTIRSQLAQLKEEQDTVNLILKNMKEGLVLLDSELRIVMVNDSASTFLLSGYGEHQAFTGKYFVELTRSTELLSAAEKAAKDETVRGLLESEERTLQYIASPVFDNGEISGVLLFLMDVTEQRKAQKIREEFTANVSHELKTPLTSITGFAELLQSGMVKQEAEVEKFSSLIYTESRRLLSLIDDVMRLSQIEEGKAPAEQTPVNLSKVAADVCNELSAAAQARKVSLQLDAPQPVTLTGQAGMLHELVFNLTENAIKYNKPQGSVLVSVQQRENGCILTVSDTGIGIPREHQDRIFERFYRVDKSRSKQTGGTGLGLSIVKHIVEYHGGRIQLESVENRGTTVTITL